SGDGTATELTTGPNTGMILLAGGGSHTVQLYNPTASAINGVQPGRFAWVPNMTVNRAHFTATRLSDGYVLAVGGVDYSTGLARNTAELYNPTTGTWTTVATMSTPRQQHTATLVP